MSVFKLPIIDDSAKSVNLNYVLNKISFELLEFLLSSKDKYLVDLEAKNLSGQTLLHIAAKNGCNESVKLLLNHGAFIEAKDINGMTPLHLAIQQQHSPLGENYLLTIKTLLEFNADSTAKDNSGRSVLSHLSQVPLKETIQKLLQPKDEDRERRRKGIQEWNQKIEITMNELETELSTIMGLDNIKLQLRKWAKGMLLDERRRALGLKVGAKRPPHMAFLGNPGTGKTMIARFLGKLMKMLGVLPTDKVIEVQRTDLVGEYIGQTGPKTKKKIKKAEGGILFVDEAYRLVQVLNSAYKDFGREALEEIMSVMESGKLVVIFAGYSEQMKNVISCNEGFSRRVTKYFHFDDFNCEDLANILHLKMSNQSEESNLYGFKLHPLCSLEAVTELIEKKTSVKQRKEMNGGLIEPLLANARENLDMRLGLHCEDPNELLTITLEDLEVGIEFLSQQKKPSTETPKIIS